MKKDLDYAKMNRQMVVEVLEDLRGQLSIVKPPKYHNCVAYAIWALKGFEKNKEMIEILEDEISYLKKEIKSIETQEFMDS